MDNKNILKIILVMQLLAFALASYGHPDAEVFSLPNQPSRDELIIEAAIKRGMDGEAVAELLRTRLPVVRTSTTRDGFTKTTTYKLEPDGSISSKSVMQKRNRYVYNSDSIPDELKNSPTGTITRTFTDSDGNKVTQTVAINQGLTPLSSAKDEDTDDLSGKWFSETFPSWQDETPSSPPYHKQQKTITRTFTSPKGDRRVVQSWSSDPDISEPKTPNRSSTTIRTFSRPNEEKHVELSKPKFPFMGNTNWPDFDYSSFSQPWDNLDPDNTNGWEVMEEPEATTKTKKDEWDWTKFASDPTTTTTTVNPKETLTPRPLPNLDDFLRSQYGRPPSKEPLTTTLRPRPTSTPRSFSSTPKIIKIEDLPVVEVLHNGKPASENILKTLPAHLTPRTPLGPVLKIENKHPIEDLNPSQVEEYTPKMETTNMRSYSKTLVGPEKPTLKDLDPQMQDILRNAGIVPEIEGDSITKTRTEPDGRVITTSYKVNTMPMDYTTTKQHYIPPQMHPVYKPTFNSQNPFLPGYPSHVSPISEFLAKLGLTKFDISSRNGHYTKTLIDENGEVLTATFVLSSPYGPRHPLAKPLVNPFK